MKFTVNKERLKLAEKAQETIVSNSIDCHIALIRARHENNAEAVSQLTEACSVLRLITELLDDEIARMKSLLEQNWNLN